MNEHQDSEWHLDKRVNISIVVALLLQAASIIWWGSAMSQRVANLEKYHQNSDDMVAKVARLEQSVAMQNQTMTRVENKLDRLIEAERRP